MGGMNAYIENNSQPKSYIFQHHLLPLLPTASPPLSELLASVFAGVGYRFEKRIGQK